MQKLFRALFVVILAMAISSCNHDEEDVVDAQITSKKFIVSLVGVDIRRKSNDEPVDVDTNSVASEIMIFK